MCVVRLLTKWRKNFQKFYVKEVGLLRVGKWSGSGVGRGVGVAPEATRHRGSAGAGVRGSARRGPPPQGLRRVDPYEAWTYINKSVISRWARSKHIDSFSRAAGGP